MSTVPRDVFPVSMVGTVAFGLASDVGVTVVAGVAVAANVRWFAPQPAAANMRSGDRPTVHTRQLAARGGCVRLPQFHETPETTRALLVVVLPTILLIRMNLDA